MADRHRFVDCFPRVPTGHRLGPHRSIILLAYKGREFRALSVLRSWKKRFRKTRIKTVLRSKTHATYSIAGHRSVSDTSLNTLALEHNMGLPIFRHCGNMYANFRNKHTCVCEFSKKHPVYRERGGFLLLSTTL